MQIDCVLCEAEIKFYIIKMNLRLERVTVTPRAGLVILLIRKATQ